MDEFNELLRSWQNFYFMIGGASATLIGLIIIALSLGINTIRRANKEDVANFSTPSVFYFVATLLVAGAMLVPDMTPVALALLLFAGGGFGLLRILWYIRGVIRYAHEHQDFELVDWLTQVILPLFGYILILLAALGFVMTQWTLALMLLWFSALVIIVCGIANAWSLVMTVIDQRPE